MGLAFALTEKWKSDALRAAKEAYPKESCGLVVYRKGLRIYWPCKNISRKAIEHFHIDPFNYAEAEDAGTIVGVVHSHPNETAVPSDFDIEECKRGDLPWYVIDPLEETIVGIACSDVPLLGRSWDWGLYDCGSLVRDYFKTKNIPIPYYPRIIDEKKFYKDCPVDKVWSTFGFRELEEDESLRENDMLLMGMGKNIPYHAGIYIGGQKILHHSEFSLSTEDTYGRYLIESTVRRLRYAS